MKFRLLRADEIDCRVSMVQSWGIGLLLYKDARCDQNILDETVGSMNWQRHHCRDNANCIVSIWDDDKKQWVEKEDTGTESNTEAEKGLASDSFKRACFNWGIGRELYTAQAMFVYAKDLKTHTKDDRGKWTCKDYFRVVDIEYLGRKIVRVDVLNEKTGVVHTFGSPAESVKKQQEIAAQTIGKVKADALAKVCADKGVDVQAVLDRYGVSALDNLTEEQHLRALAALERSNGNNRQS